eukprot:1804805-Rhodomonas_salina.6
MLSSTNTRHVASYPLVSTNENEDEEEDEQQQKNDPERERELDDKNTTGRKRELAEMRCEGARFVPPPGSSTAPRQYQRWYVDGTTDLVILPCDETLRCYASGACTQAGVSTRSGRVLLVLKGLGTTEYQSVVLLVVDPDSSARGYDDVGPSTIQPARRSVPDLAYRVRRTIARVVPGCYGRAETPQ